MMRIVSISDTHGMHNREDFPTIPEGDILIHSGDATSKGSLEEFTDFIDWLASQPHTHKIFVAGNHDICLDESFIPEKYVGYIPIAELLEKSKDLSIKAKDRIPDAITYLEDSSTIIDGVKFYGSPWTPRFFNWAFNRNRGPAIAERWEKIPGDTHVLITHGPSYGHGDLAPPWKSAHPRHAGCFQLLHALIQVLPIAHIFGHIHGGCGIYQSDEIRTTFINAAICDEKYRPLNKPQIFDLSQVSTDRKT